jgi:hypothetical protein
MSSPIARDASTMDTHSPFVVPNHSEEADSQHVFSIRTNVCRRVFIAVRYPLAKDFACLASTEPWDAHGLDNDLRLSLHPTMQVPKDTYPFAQQTLSRIRSIVLASFYFWSYSWSHAVSFDKDLRFLCRACSSAIGAPQVHASVNEFVEITCRQHRHPIFGLLLILLYPLSVSLLVVQTSYPR